jgi:hypothetical protein
MSVRSKDGTTVIEPDRSHKPSDHSEKYRTKRHESSHSSPKHHGSSHSSSRHDGSCRSNHESSSREQSQQGPDNATARHTERIKTENNPIGDMNRTFLEGMKVPTAMLQTQAGSSTRKHSERSSKVYSSKAKDSSVKGLIPASQYKNHPQRTYPNNSANVASMAPRRTLTIFNTEEDKRRQSQHTKLSTLNPRDLSKHHEWAGTQIQRFAPCPQGFPWNRVEGGYQCTAKHHYITDELFTEGNGGIWVVPDGDVGKFDEKWGPYYAEPEHPTWFFYCGPDPIPHGPLKVLDEGAEHYEEFRAKLMEARRQQSMAGTRPGSIMQTLNSARRTSRARPSGAASTQHFGTNGNWGHNQTY